MEVSRITPENIESSDLGFRLGPRINARGRLAHAGLAVDLMLTRSPSEAAQWASLLDQANLRRRDIEADTVASAQEQLKTKEALGNAVVVYSEEWHPGVIGLVAAKLVREWNRPAIVIGEGKSSARSIPSVDIHKVLSEGKDLLEKFGGHKAAAGLTIDAQVPAFESRVSEAVEAQVGQAPYALELIERLISMKWISAGPMRLRH